MGAYLSSPITENISDDNSTEKYSYGASSMQGWRVSQEDAHNCCPDFDKEKKTSLFAVYDGHGGEEVAKYCSLHLPDFIKTMPSYSEGHLPQALEDAFLGFDELLTQENVINELKQLAGLDPEEEAADKEEEAEEEAMLYEEASLPLEDVIARYTAKPDGSRLNALRKSNKLQSPMIHAKKTVNGEGDGSLLNSNNEAEIKTKLEDKLVNGHADNENNMNLEKEAKAAQNDSSSECHSEIVDDKKVGHKHSNSKDTDISSSDMKDPSPSGTNGSSGDVSDNKNRVSSESCNSAVSTTAGSTSNAGGSSDVSTTVQSGESDAANSSATVSTTADSTAPTSVSTTVDSASDNVDSSSSKDSSSEVSASSTSKAEEDPEPCSSSGRTSKKSSDEDEESLDDEDEEEEEELDSEDESDEDAWCPHAGVPDDDEDECDEEEEAEDEEDGAVCMAGRDEKEEPGSDSGCTAVVALLKDNELHVANAGDSRCVVCRAGKALDMSVDHKPEDDLERTRIEKAGGKVTLDGRVNGGLNLSRAIGDHCYKKSEDLPLKDQMISALPDVKSITLSDEDEFMVLACDGIWNYMTSQEVVDFVKERIEKGQDKMSVICEEMFDHCLAPNTMGDGTGCDNMTGIIVNFKKQPANGESAPATKRKAEESVADSTEDTPKRPKSVAE